MECRKEESMTEKYFPQVGDNELMLTEMPHMNLYDETDLISNITGDYVDKNYLEWQPIAENTKPKHPYHQPLEEPLPKRRPVRKPNFKEPIDKKSPANELLKYSKRLRQDQLILAEFESAGEPEVAEPTEKKNNYDFLKTSQIYNKDQHKLKPQPIKQELDLTHLDQE